MSGIKPEVGVRLGSKINIINECLIPQCEATVTEIREKVVIAVSGDTSYEFPLNSLLDKDGKIQAVSHMLE